MRYKPFEDGITVRHVANSSNVDSIDSSSNVGNTGNRSSVVDIGSIVMLVIAERLSARQLIVQCGLKSQLAYYIYICAQLPSRLGMQLNLRLRSLYVLLLCLYVPYTCCYYSCDETLPAPGNLGHPGGQARVQDGVLTSYMDAAFVLLTPE